MSPDISFDENEFKYKSRAILGTPEVPKMTRFLMAKGIVKNEKAAQTFLFVTAITFFVISLIVVLLFIFGIKISGTKSEDPEAAIRREAAKQRLIQIRNTQITNVENKSP